MGIKLTKGQNVALDDGLKDVRVGLGWDARETEGEDFDLDAVCFMLTANGKVRNDGDCVFYNQLCYPPNSATYEDGSLKSRDANNAVAHTGDNLTGDGEGDDETLLVKLDKIPAEIQKIVFTVTIHEHDVRKQNFGMVSDAFIRIVNNSTDEEIARFDLSEDASTNTAMIFGEIYRKDGKWKFRAVGQGFNHGLEQVCKSYGVSVE
ncbi:MAG: TerD family protein [Planctomycetaceae bacterium]|nr:TerD family protein [Planctomycetaceae bacterium]